MKDLNSLPLTTENSGLGSNFPFKILIFELRSFPPLKFPVVTGWAWIFSGTTNLGTLCIHCCLGAHVPQIAKWQDSRLSGCEGDCMTIIIISFPHFITDFFSSFIFHHHIPKITIVYVAYSWSYSLVWVDHCIQGFLLCAKNNTSTGPAQREFFCHSVGKPNRIQRLYWLNSCFWKSRSLLTNLVPMASHAREILGTRVTADFD